MDEAPATSRRAFLATLAGGIATFAAPTVHAQERDAQATRMRDGQPSATARSAAMHRAIHQLVDAPLVFPDRFAAAMVAPASASELRGALDGAPALRAAIVLRSRHAEDTLAEGVKRGVRQYVVLGAGLDSFACRNPHAARGLAVFEVDHPATQAYKRRHLATAGIKPAPRTTFVPVDFETQSLATQLRASGFRFDRPAFFSLLGVAIDLSREALMGTMEVVAKCARGSAIAFDFALPEELLGERQREARLRSSARMATIGEPWIGFHEPDALAWDLRKAGFRTMELLGPDDANRLYFTGRSDSLRASSVHMMVARV